MYYHFLHWKPEYVVTAEGVVNATSGEVVSNIYVFDIPPRDNGVNNYPIHISSETHPLYLNRSRYGCLIDVINLLDALKAVENIKVNEQELEITVRFLLKKLQKHIYTPEFKLALLYVSLEINKVVIDLNLISRIFNVPRSRLVSAILSIKSELLNTYSGSKTSASDKMVLLLKHYAQKFELPDEAIKSAIKLVKSKPYPSKYSPKSLVLAIIYWELKKVEKQNNGSKAISFNKLIKQVGASTNLRKAIKFVENYYYGNGNDKNKSVF